jgi:hypothetical protein
MDETTTIEETPKRDYAHLGHLGGAAIREKRGTGYLRKIAGKGGRATKARQDPDFYARIGRKGAQRKYENWLEAKKLEAAHG